MGTYRFSKCGNCGHFFETGEWGRDSAFGPPMIKCSLCDSLNKTNYTLFRDMSFFKKASVIFGQFFRVLLFGIGGIFFSIGWIWNFLDLPGVIQNGVDSIVGFLLMLAIPIGILIYAISEIRSFLNLFKTIKTYEKMYDKNKGFLWSNEWFS